MQYDEFIRQVEDRARLDRTGAERAAQATLATLAERITEGEATDLASQLPQELKPPLEATTTGGEPFDVAEFIRRVAEREGALADLAREHARAVLSTVQEAVTSGQFQDVVSQLPEDYMELLGA